MSATEEDVIELDESISDGNDNETSDLRDSIIAATEEVETNDGETLGMEAAKPEGDDDAASGDEGKQIQKGDEQKAEGAEGAAAKGDEGADEGAAPIKSKSKAPVGWNAEAREHWDKIPAGVQAQISAREDEVARTIHGTLDARKTHEFLSNLSSSYAPVLAAEGMSSPAQAIENMFKTVAELRLGSPQQKAAKVAEIISNYGIDIGVLDSTLAGNGVTNSGDGGGNAELEHMIDSKMQPFNDVIANLNSMQQGQQVGRQKAADDAVGKFSEDAEFINDVRMDMADLLDLADKHGRELSLDDAYKKACSLNPEIQKVLDGRAEQKSILEKKTNATKKLNAGSSISGTGAGAPGSEGDLSLRDQISSIWDNYTE